MSWGKRSWRITAFIFIACGALFAFIGLMACGFDFSKINTLGDPERNEYVITESFTGIRVDTSTADVTIKESRDGKVKVVCDEREKEKHEVKVVDGVLDIKLKRDVPWYDRLFNFSFSDDQKVVIYLPKQENKEWEKYGFTPFYTLDSLSIGVSTGDVNLDGLAVTGELKVDVSTGHTTLSNIGAGTLNVDESTGKTTLTNVISKGEMRLNAGTGDIILTKCDAGTVVIDTGTGDVSCEFLSPKVVEADTGTGDVVLSEKYETGGRCRIDTGTGDISVKYVK